MGECIHGHISEAEPRLNDQLLLSEAGQYRDGEYGGVAAEEAERGGSVPFKVDGGGAGVGEQLVLG